MPSAPPAAGGPGSSCPGGYREVLDLAPPLWLPDSYAASCGHCFLPFKPLARLRHHCRLCGKIFCHACCHKKLLLPPKYADRCARHCRPVKTLNS